MKKVILLLLAIFVGNINSIGQKLWLDKERNNLLEGLIKTKADLLNEIRGLGQNQMSFKPDANSWSIADVVEHVGVYEELLYWDLLYQQHTPEKSELVDKVKGNDAELLSYATDPGRGKAPWIAEPIGRFEDKQALVQYFVNLRNKVIALIKETDSDFRVHFIYREPTNSIWDLRDLHQYTLVWIAHTERHTHQIRRIKSNPSFPKHQQKLWTEENRAFLLEGLERTKNKMILETENLSKAQWHFKPSEDSWSIRQVVEHIGLYERIVLQEAKIANSFPPQPEYFQEAKTDSDYLAWMAEKNPHVAPKNATPLGLMEGKNNLTFFLFGRDLILNYIKNTDSDLKAQFTPRKSEPNNRRSIHGLFVIHFGHTDRHLRQIARIKADANYPKG